MAGADANDVGDIPIFHITHIDNLARIIADGCLWSDRQLEEKQTKRVVIGLNKIKRRRMEEQWVTCHPGTRVGDYVPFYFCPRSPMLHFIHMKNEELEYQDGQDQVIHLVSRITHAIGVSANQRIAFSDINAGVGYAQFFSDLTQLNRVLDWKAINARWWSGPQVDRNIMPKKMAEFLVHECFHWTGVLGIGVVNEAMKTQVIQVIERAAHQPAVAVRRGWYY